MRVDNGLRVLHTGGVLEGLRVMAGRRAVFGWHRGWLRWLAVTVAAVVGAQLALATPTLATPRDPKWHVNTPASIVKPVPRGKQQGTTGSPGVPVKKAPAYKAPAVRLPAAGTSTVRLAAEGAAPLSNGARSAASTHPTRVRVTGSPVWVGPSTDAADGATPAQVAVTFAPSGTAAKAGVNSGLLFGVARDDGTSGGHGRVEVQLDTSALAGRYGGNYAQRLRFVQLPVCALTAPQQPACQKRSPVPESHDPATGRLTADIDLPSVPGSGAGAPMVVLAADSTPAGSTGTYAATSLKGSDQWSAGGATGNFSYAYPIDTPPALGGAGPDVSLSYSSADVDGLTASTNAQSSWIGTGWSYDPGYIERSYEPCSDDGLSGSGDTCWAYGGHEVSLGGNSSAGQVVYDDSSHTWHLSNDSGATIQLLTGANNDAYQGEYWVITQQDGTRYYYGAGHLPSSEGGTGADPATTSAWTQPVYCPHSGDLCYNAGTGTGSFATNMAYRWNLDYVVDPHGNTIVYTYGREPNYYARGASHALTQYTRGGYLTQVAYGWRTPDVASAAKPAEKVLFKTGQRCTGATTECSSYTNLNSSTAKDWPDTPYDQVCPSTGTCNNTSMSYFSTAELTQIQTVVNEGGTDKTIDTYTLAHSFPDPGDASSPSLWLDGITHTGNDATTAVTLPQVTFGGELLPNRVPGSGTYPDYDHQRLTSIKTETGEQISVTYTTTTPSIAACSQTPGAQVLPSPTNNTMLCYQQYWTKPGQANPVSDWFEKYVVSSVWQVDMVASSPTVISNYTYKGTPAWHRDDSPTTKNAQRSWNQFRGFGQVITETGDPTSHDPITETSTTYLRGMNGDYTSQSGGSQRSVTVADSLGDQVVDENRYADMELETDVYDQADGAVQSKHVTLPWSASTATHAEPSPAGLPAETANFVETGTTRTAGLLTNGTWRTTKTINVYASDTGLLQRTDTQGDQSLVGTDNSQETCTTTTHATPPAGLNTRMVNSPARVTTVSVTTGGPIGTDACPTPTPGNTVSDAVTYYDGGATPGVISSVGDPTRIDAIDGFTNGTPTYKSNTTGAVFDVYGRQTSTTDARGLTTTIAYTPATGALPTSTVDTNVAKSWTTTTTLDQGRQLPTKVVDLNGNTTTEMYDGLGRLLYVWLPGRATNLGPNIAHAYGVNGTSAPSYTWTQTLRDTGTSYASQYDIYDGNNRLRQTQTSALGGNSGSLVADTFYDSHGWTVKQTNSYYEASDPFRTIYPAADASVPAETLTTYDGQGRAVVSTFDSYAQAQWKTITAYPGADRTDVTPPTGGTATSTFTDALGRTSALWSYTTPTPTGNSADARVVTYAYAPSGKTAKVTGPGGQIWTYTYDLRGNQISETDPDAGTSSATYYAAGDLKTSTDARGQTLAYTYDTMGRKTGQYSGSTSGRLLASWTYDTAPGGLGLAATSTAYLDSGGTTLHYTTSVDGYTNKGAPTGTTIKVESVVGSDETPLAGSYDTTMTYMPISGLPATVTYGAHGGLPAETVTYTYDRSGDLANLAGLANYMVTSAVDPFGRPHEVTMGNMPNEVKQTNDYDTATGRVSEQFLDKEYGSTHVEDVTTLYNPAGMVTAVKDVQDGTSTDLQCYGYNQLDQLTTAWTDNGDVHTAASPSVPNIGGCNTTNPAASNLGGPAKYWQSFDYNDSGNRTTEVDHAADGNTANDITHTYHYTGATGTGGQPDTLQSLTTTGPGGITTDTYQYDPAGNTKQWSIDGGAHNAITYTPQGQTATLTDPTTGNIAGYTYDADGNLLLQRDTKGGTSTVTLYLSSSEQLTLNTATGAVSGLRYYPVPGGPTEVRSSDGTLTYEYANAQNTGDVTISADASQTVTRRYFTPYGQTRGTSPIGWVDNRAFLNQPADPVTGLDLLGDRNYDPATGHFLQRDPVQELTDPGQLSGYTYAADNPVNGADPTGDCAFSDGDFCISHGSDFGQTPTGGSGHDVTTGDQNCCTVHGSGNNSGGGAPKSKPKKCGTFDLKCHAKKLAHAANTFYQAHKAIIATVADYAVGTLAFGLCEAATDGAGTIACAALGGALGNLVNHALNPQAGDDSVLGFATDMLTGAVAGAAGGAAGELLSAGAGVLLRTPAARKLITSAVDDGVESGGSALARAASKCSFTASTLVLMADGSTKPIGAIAVGDKVESGDPATTTNQPETVALLHDNLDTDLTDLTVTDSTGQKSTVHTTQNHPFWDATRQEWTPAGQLHPGDQLRTPTGITARVVSVENTVGLSEMLNLTVTDYHTYYVVAGNTPVLVHNCGGTATVRWDVDMEHATIRVEGGGKSLETEQVVSGWDGVGSPNGLPTTGARAEPLGPNVIERTFDVPDAGAAMEAQQSSIGADLGGYDGIHNSCVTYCVSILRAGGVDIPAGARGMVALKRTLG